MWGSRNQIREAIEKLIAFNEKCLDYTSPLKAYLLGKETERYKVGCGGNKFLSSVG